MTCSGVRACGITSNTHPTSAIRLWPFSPMPGRVWKFFTRWPGALVRSRRDSGSIATPLPSADSASGPGAGSPSGTPGSGPGPGCWPAGPPAA
jgi:hypothetical protein